MIAFVYNWKLTLVVGVMLPVLSFLVTIMAKVGKDFSLSVQCRPMAACDLLSAVYTS